MTRTSKHATFGAVLALSVFVFPEARGQDEPRGLILKEAGAFEGFDDYSDPAVILGGSTQVREAKQSIQGDGTMIMGIRVRRPPQMKGCTKIVGFAAFVWATATPAWGQQNKGIPEDEEAVHQVLETFQETLNRQDAKRLAALFYR